VLPEGLKGTFARKLVQDVISSANPYAPLTVPPMAKAAGVISATPEVVFVPNDPALGYYRPLFANQVCLLEEREPVPDGIRTRSSAKTFNKLIEENDNQVDQTAVLRARLLDIFMGDWDRHFDQWRFAQFDTGRGKLYEPIPRDRDQVYFNNDGLLLNLVTRQHLQQFSGFKHKMRNTRYLGFNARHFDRVFLTDLNAEDWRKALHAFDSAMSDDVLQAAVKQFPPEIYPLCGPEILSKLRDRKKQMMSEGLKYQRFLSQYVNVLGSQNKEIFYLSSEDDSLVRIKVYEMKKNGRDTDYVMYNRTVNPKVTEEVRLYGFQNDDKFFIDSNVHTHRMKVRMIGGKGADTFNVEGRVKNFVYDFTGENNQVEQLRNSEVRTSSNPAVNNFDLNETQFDKTFFPAFTGGYNPEDGLLLGLGLESYKYGFRKVPYQRLHKLNALAAVAEKAFRVTYNGTFIDLVRYNDLQINATMHTPTLDNFYGLGNETKIQEGRDQSYYRVRYSFAAADVLIRRRMFNNVLSLAAGPTAYYYWNTPERNEGKILENPSQVGLTNAVYEDKSYLGAKAVVQINNLSNTLFPTRGIDWTTTFSSMAGLGGDAKSITRLTSEMSVYAALSDPAKLVAVMRLGGGKIFSDQYEYFQALGIGQNNYLRGFRRNRFSGKGMAYGSLELRAKLFDVNSYFLPGAFGLVGFGDAARVWTDNDQSAKWHFAPGAGFYYTPFDLVLVSGTVAFSEEQTLFNLTVGTRFNLTF
jgi:hypothetical protein